MADDMRAEPAAHFGGRTTKDTMSTKSGMVKDAIRADPWSR